MKLHGSQRDSPQAAQRAAIIVSSRQQAKREDRSKALWDGVLLPVQIVSLNK